MSDLAVPVTAAFGASYTQLRDALGEGVRVVWAGLETYNDETLPVWLARVEPLANAGVHASATLAQGYVELLIGRSVAVIHPGLTDDPGWPDRYSGAFHRVWRALSQGDALPEAVARGLAEAQRIVDTDVQSAMLAGAERTGAASGRAVTGWRRVLGHGDTCGLCQAAATRIYRKGDLAPIHDHCTCSVAPVLADADPGRAVNEERT